MDFNQIQIDIERRRKMFYWFIDGLGTYAFRPDNTMTWISRHGLSWGNYDHLTPDYVTKYFNVNI